MRAVSVAISFKIGLGFHALNNEGGGGTNVMEPRRITIGGREHDGISGEMVRRHVLENFVRLCEARGIPLSKAGRGLLPDRGKEDLVQWMKDKKLKELEPQHYSEATAELLRTCAVRDVGGYLMALESADKAKGTLKRDSTFEVGWLITGHEAAVDFTQHAAYHPAQDHHLFNQNLRTGLYGGVARFDLHRVGRSDWAWYDGSDPLVLTEEERTARIEALLEAFAQYLLSPGGAKQAGWLQHTGALEGTMLVSGSGPAPFISPLEVKAAAHGPAGAAFQEAAAGAEDAAAGAVAEDEVAVSFNPSYQEAMARLAAVRPDQYQVWHFGNQTELLEQMAALRERLTHD